MKKVSIKSQVVNAIETLRPMGHGELFAWAKENGMNTRAGFSAFKRALLENGINYDELRADHKAAKADALSASITHEVTLFSDAKASCDRFAICEADGEPVWYGRFFDDDRDGYNGEQSSGELSAALKAIWLASKIKEAAGLPAIRLHLIVDANWLCTLSGKASALAKAATRHNIELEMEWIKGTENPADQWTVSKGFQRWNECPLAAFAKEVAQ